jgi:hypothetical protein
MQNPQIPQIAWAIVACGFIIWGLLNILNVFFDPYAFKGSSDPHSLSKGIFSLVCGFGYFVTRIIHKYRNKKAPD